MPHVADQLKDFLKSKTSENTLQKLHYRMLCFNKGLCPNLLWDMLIGPCFTSVFWLNPLKFTKASFRSTRWPFDIASINRDVTEFRYNKTLVEHLQEYEMSSLEARVWLQQSRLGSINMSCLFLWNLCHVQQTVYMRCERMCACFVAARGRNCAQMFPEKEYLYTKKLVNIYLWKVT